MMILIIAQLFLFGSFMFSYWLGIIAGKDLKTVGDGNPGAFNLWSAAGFKFGILGVIFDFMKGYLPLLIFIRMGYIKEASIIPAAIAPILGHVFSPFMKFKGGKGIAVTFGVWSAITGFKASLFYAIVLAVFLFFAKLLTKGKPTSSEIDAFMDVMGLFALGIYLWIGGYPEELIVVWVANLLLLIYSNRVKLQRVLRTALSR